MAGKEERAAPPKTQRKGQTCMDVPPRQVLGTARGGEAGPRRVSEAEGDLVQDIPSGTWGKVVCDEEGVGKEAPGPQKPARSLRIKKDQWVNRSSVEMDLFRSNEGYGRPYDKGYSSTVYAPMVDRQTNASLCAPY